MERNSLIQTVVTVLVVVLVLTVAAFVIPFRMINWGSVSLLPSSTITVIGEAKTEQQNQIASFNAGVSAINADKQAALDEVNQKMEALIAAVKGFGIPDADVKTQNVSVYQQQEGPVDLGTRSGSQLGDWHVNNTVDVTLRDVARASELTDLLAATGATNVYGPNFRLDDTQTAEVELIDEAIQNAREKADKIAASSGKRLGGVVTVNEAGASGIQPLFDAALSSGKGGGSAVEVGTGTVYKSVTVTFELK